MNLWPVQPGHWNEGNERQQRNKAQHCRKGKRRTPTKVFQQNASQERSKHQCSTNSLRSYSQIHKLNAHLAFPDSLPFQDMTSYCQESPNRYGSFRARRSSILSKLAALAPTLPWKPIQPRHLTIPPELRTATQLVSMAPLDARKPANVCTMPIISNPGDTSKKNRFFLAICSPTILVKPPLNHGDANFPSFPFQKHRGAAIKAASKTKATEDKSSAHLRPRRSDHEANKGAAINSEKLRRALMRPVIGKMG